MQNVEKGMFGITQGHWNLYRKTAHSSCDDVFNRSSKMAKIKINAKLCDHITYHIPCFFTI